MSEGTRSKWYGILSRVDRLLPKSRLTDPDNGRGQGPEQWTVPTFEIEEAEAQGIEFILKHKLFQSHQTGKIIDNKMLMLSYPSRWRYDILRALDYFQTAKIKYDRRMNAAIEILIKKRRKDGKWPLQMKHPGRVHFDMEAAGRPSRWNTLRSLRVLHHLGIS